MRPSAATASCAGREVPASRRFNRLRLDGFAPVSAKERRAGVGEGDILPRDELSVQQITDIQAVDDSEQAELLTAFRRHEVRWSDAIDFGMGSFDLSVKADVGLAGLLSDCEKLHPCLVAQARVVLLGAEPRWHSRRSRPSPRSSCGSTPGAGRSQSS